MSVLNRIIDIRTHLLLWFALIGLCICGWDLTRVSSWWRGTGSIGGTTPRRQRAWLTRVIAFTLMASTTLVDVMSDRGRLWSPASAILLATLALPALIALALVPVVTASGRPTFLVAPRFRAKVGSGRK